MSAQFVNTVEREELGALVEAAGIGKIPND